MSQLKRYLEGMPLELSPTVLSVEQTMQTVLTHRPADADLAIGRLVEQVRRAVPDATMALIDRLQEVLAGATGQEIGCQTLSRTLGVPAGTMLKLLVAAERAGVWRRLVSFDRMASTIDDKSKGYVTNTSHACAVAGITTISQMKDSNRWGLLFETFIVNSIAAQLDALTGVETALYYWRTTQGQQEIDLIVSAHGRLYPIEIKSSVRSGLGDAENITSFMRRYKQKYTLGMGSVVYAGHTQEPLSEEVSLVPWWHLLDA